MTKIIAVVMMMITLNVNAMPHYVCGPMKGLAESTIEIKLKGVTLDQAMMVSRAQWRDNGTAEYIQDYLSGIIEIGYETSLDGQTYGQVVYDHCRTHEITVY